MNYTDRQLKKKKQTHATLTDWLNQEINKYCIPSSHFSHITSLGYYLYFATINPHLLFPV